MVNKLILENFTVFEKLEMDFSPGINILIGKNGTGKTHTLKAIYSLLYTKKNLTDSLDKFISVFLPYSKDQTRLIRFEQKEATVKIYYPGKVTSSEDNMEITIKKGAFSPGFGKGFDVCATGGIKGEIYQGKAVYIPVKDMLANAPKFISLYEERYIHFEEIYKDILIKANLAEIKILPDFFRKTVKTIGKAIGGKVVLKNEEFFLETPDENQIEFTLVAEGMRKLALLLLLLKNGSISKGSLLLWDEPETNMNPVLIRLIVEILLQLEQEGVQIILATHSYVLLNEFDLQRKEKHKIKHFSLYKENDSVKANCSEFMDDLQPNDISSEFASMYDQETKKALGLLD